MADSDSLFIFWFLLIRPQHKRQKTLEKKRNALQKGDKIITGGGIYAKVLRVKQESNSIVAEIANGVMVELAKTTIMHVLTDDDNKKK